MAAPEPPAPPQHPPGGLLNWLTAVKGLTVTNAIVIMMLVVVAIPAYLVYKALNDTSLLDRFLSHYEEIASSQYMGCTLRTANQRGGADIWSISTGFAYQGASRWSISATLSHRPTDSEIISYCESLKLIADKMLEP